MLVTGLGQCSVPPLLLPVLELSDYTGCFIRKIGFHLFLKKTNNAQYYDFGLISTFIVGENAIMIQQATNPHAMFNFSLVL